MNNLKYLLNKIYVILCSIFEALSDYLQSKHEQKQKQQLEMQEYSRACYIRSVMYEMQKDLFEVFQHRRYYFMADILDSADIRVSGYKIRGNIVIYNFQLAKSTNKHVDATIAAKIRNNMNADIEQTRYRLETLGTLYDYPFIARGLNVVGVKDAGLALEVSVIINYPV